MNENILEIEFNKAVNFMDKYRIAVFKLVNSTLIEKLPRSEKKRCIDMLDNFKNLNEINSYYNYSKEEKLALIKLYKQIGYELEELIFKVNHYDEKN